jgi:hypothetical protein
MSSKCKSETHLKKIRQSFQEGEEEEEKLVQIVMTRTYVWNVYCMIIDNDIGTVINVVDLY